MKCLVGVLLVLIGIALSLWIGVWLMFIGGIVQLVQSITPVVVAKGIAFGIARIFLSGLVGWLSALVCILPGIALVQSS